MKTDTEWIESFLERTLSADELRKFTARRATDLSFRQTLFAQARVHVAALLYGRNIRRVQILNAGEKAFSDLDFANQINAIFR